jgi:proteasome lid subunit RPN8/RPN11
VDDINVSERHRISGRCITQFGIGFAGDIHTHPGYNCELSDEDRSLQVDRQYRCVQCDEVLVGPTGDVGGLACWKVSETTDGYSFQEVEVGIQ